MYRILIIEDEPAFKRILKDTFEREEFEVFLASDGKAGIIQAAKAHPDFILLDLMLQGMSGTSVLKHIKDLTGLNEIPIAVLTAVPNGVPQIFEGRDVFDNVVGYWVKDQLSLREVVQKVKGYLKKSDMVN